MPEPDAGTPAFPGANVLWRRRWLITGIAGLVAAAALGVSLFQRPVYTAEATVLVDLPQQGATPAVPDMGTEKKIVDSASVADLVLEADRVKASVPALLAGLSVNVPVDTSILDISYTDADPEVARRGAQGFADAYLGFRLRQLLAGSQATRASLERNIAGVTAQLNRVSRRADAATGAQAKVILTTRATTLVTELTQLAQQMQALPTPEAIAAGEVIQPATTPTVPSSPNRILDLVLGLFLGLILGVGVALVVDRADDRIREPGDLTAALGTRVIGVVPPPTHLAHGERWPALFAPDADQGMLESFRSLRSDFLLAAAQRGVKSVLISSCRAEEGKTQTLAYLGEVLASSEKRVVMVSGDLRFPRLDSLFGLEGTPGLADVLSGRTHVADARRDVGPSLRLVTAGTLPADPAQLLSGGELPAVVGALEKEADFVLVDSPPMLSVPDTRVMLPACDAVVFVADARTTTRSELAEARRQLDWSRAEVIGVVLLNAKVDRARSYPPNPEPPSAPQAVDPTTGAEPRPVEEADAVEADAEEAEPVHPL